MTAAAESQSPGNGRGVWGRRRGVPEQPSARRECQGAHLEQRLHEEGRPGWRHAVVAVEVAQSAHQLRATPAARHDLCSGSRSGGCTSFLGRLSAANG